MLSCSACPSNLQRKSTLYRICISYFGDLARRTGCLRTGWTPSRRWNSKGPNRACHRATLWCENIRTEQNHSRECTTRTDRKMLILFYSVWVGKVLNLMLLSWLNWRNSYLQCALTPHTIYYWCTIIACVCMIMHYGAKTVTVHHHNTFGSGAIARTFPVIYFARHYEGPPNITVVSVNIMDWACGLMHANIQHCKQKGVLLDIFFSDLLRSGAQ